MPSPPQGFSVILPGEITQSDLDPQQPPAQLSSYPLTIGKDIPGPNESNYVANDNTGNLLNIVNSDTSSTTLSALKMAIDALTIIRTNGELGINLANANSWSATQSFSAGMVISGAPSNDRTLDLTSISSFSPYADKTFNLHFLDDSDAGSWEVFNYNGTASLSVGIGTNHQLKSIENTLDDGSGNMSVSGSLATPTLNLNGAGAISALVSSFNSRTGAVVPVSGDYTIGTTLPDANESNYVANDNTGNLLDIVNSDTSSTTLSAAKIATDRTTLIDSSGELALNLANENSWSAAQSFTAGLATNSLNLNGAGSISALVSSFNGRTGAVVPTSGDYSHHTHINNTDAVTYDGYATSTQIGTITTGPNGVVLWNGSCLTETPSSGGISISIGDNAIITGIGPTSTGNNWAVYYGATESGAYYPVIFTGMADSSFGSLSPNTTYDVYINNMTQSSITVLYLNIGLIGL